MVGRANSPSPGVLQNPQNRVYMQKLNPTIYQQQVQQAGCSLVPLNRISNTPRLSEAPIRASTPIPLLQHGIQPKPSGNNAFNIIPPINSPLNYMQAIPQAPNINIPNNRASIGGPLPPAAAIPVQRLSLNPYSRPEKSESQGDPHQSAHELQETKILPCGVISNSSPKEKKENDERKDVEKTESNDGLEGSTNPTSKNSLASKQSKADEANLQEELQKIQKDKAKLEQLLVLKESIIYNMSETCGTIPEVAAMQLGAQAIQIANEAMQNRKKIQKLEADLDQWKNDAKTLADSNQQLENILDEQKKQLIELAETQTRKDRHLLEVEGKYKAAIQEVQQSENLLKKQLSELARTTSELETEGALRSAQMEQLRRELAARDSRIVEMQEEIIKLQSYIADLTQQKQSLISENTDAHKRLYQVIEQSALKEDLIEEYEEKIKSANFELQKSLAEEVRRQKKMSMDLQAKDIKMEEVVLSQDQQIEILTSQLRNSSKTVDRIKSAISNTPPPDITNSPAEFSPILFRGAIPKSLLPVGTPVKNCMEGKDKQKAIVDCFTKDRVLSNQPSLPFMPVIRGLKPCDSTSAISTPTFSNYRANGGTLQLNVGGSDGIHHIATFGEPNKFQALTVPASDPISHAKSLSLSKDSKDSV